MERTTQLDWQFLEREAERVVRIVAPELNPHPLYIVSYEKTDIAGGMSNTVACTSSLLDAMLRPFVRWEGRGVAVLYQPTMFDDASDFVAAVLHEIGHAICGKFVDSFNDEIPAIFVNHRAAFLSLATATLQVPSATTSASPQLADAHHNVDWLRCVLHMRHRSSWNAGWNCSVGSVAGYSATSFEVAPYTLHQRLLRSGEYTRFEAMRFAEIVRQPLPAELEF